MKLIQHKQGFWTKYTRFIAKFLAIVSILRGVFYLFVGIYSLGDISRYSYVVFQNSIIYFLYFSFLVPLFLMYASLLFIEIDTDDQGLYMKVFIKPIMIKWDEIVEVKSQILLWGINLPKRKIMVTKSKLPFVFRVIGFVHGKTFQPSLRINSSLSDYSILMKRISKAARQNQRLEKKKQANN